MADSTGPPSVALDYAEEVFARARVPMEPVDHEVNWEDQPSRHTVFRGAPRLGLPEGMPTGIATFADAVAPRRAGERPVTLEDVATLLRCYGVVQRRLRINWNGDELARLHYPHATWARPTASGGGMYPVELYWAAGPGGPVRPGIYHYATGHHELERLAVGDVTGRVRAALGSLPAAAETDQFLLLTLRFWKNAFKYASFCYHVVTQDLGALLGSWEMVSRGLGFGLSPALWFDDEALDALLDLDPATESVHLVLPLRVQGVASHGPDALARPASAVPVVRRQPREQSRSVQRFDRVHQVHAATLVGSASRPAAAVAREAAAVEPAAGSGTALPPVLDAPMKRDLAQVLLTRRSSFGALTANPPTTLEELSTVLAASSALRGFRCDVRDEAEPQPWTHLGVLANHVDGLEQGAYHYDAQGHGLVPARQESMTRLLQRSYFLTNYNMEQVAAFLAVVGRPGAMVGAYGDRGYRMLNAEVGLVAQAIYCAATSVGLGCGAVLGVDNLTINEVLGLEGTDQRTLLFLLVGRERQGEADLASGLLAATSDPTTKEQRP